MAKPIANFPSLGWACSERAFNDIYLMEVQTGTQPSDDGYDDVWRIQITLKGSGGNIQKIQVGVFSNRAAAEMNLAMLATELNSMFALGAPQSPVQGHGDGVEDRPAWGNLNSFE